jgi:4-amino-4-deoxy-L-arabinose transferase-like glycosyltransferase
MTAAEFARRAYNPIERLYDALTDPARCERATALALAAYAAVWTLYGTIAKSSQDIHFDMGEMVAWSREAGLGTPKHPPLAAWLVRAWFSVMPAKDWSFYLFAVLLATAALWITWRLSARYLSIEKRVAGIALLTLVPFYNFHALKFNANTVLIPLWALATWWFLRSFETRRADWAALTGAAAAACMLGKYWSIFLLAGLAVAALLDPRRKLYFRSAAPWVTIAVGAILIAPHVAWIVSHHFEPFGYALDSHPATFAMAALSAIGFLAGVVGYIAAPIVFGIVATQPSGSAIRDTVWPADPDRRTIVIAFVAPLVLAAIAALLLKVEIVSLWTMSAVTPLPIVLLSSPQITLSREAGVRLLALAIIFPLLMVAAAPVIALVIHREGVPNYATHYRLIARAVARSWHAQTDKPLRIVGSYTNIVNGTIFYFRSKPTTFDIMAPELTPWVDDSRIARDGIAIVCPQPETACLAAMNAYASRSAATKFTNVTLSRRYLGTPDTPVTYRIAIIPPSAAVTLNSGSDRS